MKPLNQIAVDWAIRCFGLEHVQDKSVRSLRLAEEAVELCQAFGIPEYKMQDLVSIIYKRPKGNPKQELGGVMLTATVLAGAMGFDIEDYFMDELRRVLEKPTEHFAKRNQEKLDLGLTGDSQ